MALRESDRGGGSTSAAGGLNGRGGGLRLGADGCCDTSAGDGDESERGRTDASDSTLSPLAELLWLPCRPCRRSVNMSRTSLAAPANLSAAVPLVALAREIEPERRGGRTSSIEARVGVSGRSYALGDETTRRLSLAEGAWRYTAPFCDETRRW